MLSRIHEIQNITKQKGVLLVAVTKGRTVEEILEAYSHGIRDFGESYVQELVQKAKRCPRDIRWHFIGTLQSNKIHALAGGVSFCFLLEVPNIFMIHSVSSIKQAHKLQLALKDRKVSVLIQVNISRETQKAGVSPDHDAIDLLKKFIEEKTPNLILSGFMCINKKVHPDAVVDCSCCLFSKMNVLSREFSELSQLSMGMTDDYKHALQHGATIIRIGSAIFGKLKKES